LTKNHFLYQKGKNVSDVISKYTAHNARAVKAISTVVKRDISFATSYFSGCWLLSF